MLVVATFLSTSSDPGTRGMPRNAQPRNGSGRSVREERRGLLAALDLDCGKVVYSRVLDSPTGFAFSAGKLFVNSMYGNRIVVMNRRFDIVDSFAVALMNDLHSIRPSRTGLLITSSGTDAILEVTPDGDLGWTWLATEHGYRRTPRGVAIPVRRDWDYRSKMIDTNDQATHCNSALVTTYRGREVVLATLFHQGDVIAIDRSSGTHRTVFRGMHFPHSIRRCGNGWVVSDSYSGAAVLLDSDFWRTGVIEHSFKWVQDTIALDEGRRLIVADANNHRLVVWNVADGKAEHEVDYPAKWKVFQIEVADPGWADCFRLAGQDEGDAAGIE